MARAAKPVLIKQYDGPRLYDTEAGHYVTLEAIADLMRDRRTVIVRDAKTGGDITAATLAQIILDAA